MVGIQLHFFKNVQCEHPRVNADVRRHPAPGVPAGLTAGGGCYGAPKAGDEKIQLPLQ